MAEQDPTAREGARQEPSPATREEIETFKIYIEIAKYAITIVIALAAVCGALLKVIGTQASTQSQVWLFVIGIVLNTALFLVAHRMVSGVLDALTRQSTVIERARLIRSMNDRVYSLFVSTFGLTVLYWSVAMIAVVLCG